MDSSRKVLLGVFVIGGLLLFAVGLFWIGDRRNLFSDNITLEANFMNVSGLSRGAQVRVAGADSGEVLSVIIPTAPGNPFRVRFRVNADLQPILREDSVATIQTDGLVGNKYLQVAPGTADSPEAGPGTTIRSREPIEVGELMERINELAVSGNEAVDDIREGITRTVDAITELGTETTAMVSRLSEEVDAITSTGNEIASNLSGMIRDIRNGRGSIGRLVTDDTLYEEMLAAVGDVQTSIDNMRVMTDDLRAVSSDFRELDFSQRIDRVGANVEALTAEATNFTAKATEVLDTIQVTSGPGGLMDNVRQTLDNTNRAMANMVDNTEALKRNWFFRGFFNDRGFFNIDAVSLEEYQDNRFLADRQRITRRMDADGMFNSSNTDLTETGHQRVDAIIAEYLRYSKEDPLMIEAYAAGPDPDTLLKARDWAVAVREYLINRFELNPSYLGIMPMLVSDLPADQQNGDGVGLVLFATRGR